LTQEQLETVRQMLADGKGKRGIQATLKIGWQRIRRHIPEFARPSGPALGTIYIDPSKLKAIAELSSQGESCSSIARLLQLNRSTVRKYRPAI